MPINWRFERSAGLFGRLGFTRCELPSVDELQHTWNENQRNGGSQYKPTRESKRERPPHFVGCREDEESYSGNRRSKEDWFQTGFHRFENDSLETFDSFGILKEFVETVQKVDDVRESDADESEQSDSYEHAHRLAGEKQEEERAGKEERHREHHDERLREVLEIQYEHREHENETYEERHAHVFSGLVHVFYVRTVRHLHVLASAHYLVYFRGDGGKGGRGILVRFDFQYESAFDMPDALDLLLDLHFLDNARNVHVRSRNEQIVEIDGLSGVALVGNVSFDGYDVFAEIVDVRYRDSVALVVGKVIGRFRFLVNGIQERVEFGGSQSKLAQAVEIIGDFRFSVRVFETAAPSVRSFYRFQPRQDFFVFRCKNKHFVRRFSGCREIEGNVFSFARSHLLDEYRNFRRFARKVGVFGYFLIEEFLQLRINDEGVVFLSPFGRTGKDDVDLREIGVETGSVKRVIESRGGLLVSNAQRNVLYHAFVVIFEKFPDEAVNLIGILLVFRNARIPRVFEVYVDIVHIDERQEFYRSELRERYDYDNEKRVEEGDEKLRKLKDFRIRLFELRREFLKEGDDLIFFVGVFLGLEIHVRQHHRQEHERHENREEQRYVDGNRQEFHELPYRSAQNESKRQEHGNRYEISNKEGLPIDGEGMLDRIEFRVSLTKAVLKSLGDNDEVVHHDSEAQVERHAHHAVERVAEPLEDDERKKVNERKRNSDGDGSPDSEEQRGNYHDKHRRVDETVNKRVERLVDGDFFGVHFLRGDFFRIEIGFLRSEEFFDSRDYLQNVGPRNLVYHERNGVFAVNVRHALVERVRRVHFCHVSEPNNVSTRVQDGQGREVFFERGYVFFDGFPFFRVGSNFEAVQVAVESFLIDGFLRNAFRYRVDKEREPEVVFLEFLVVEIDFNLVRILPYYNYFVYSLNLL